MACWIYNLKSACFFGQVQVTLHTQCVMPTYAFSPLHVISSGGPITTFFFLENRVECELNSLWDSGHVYFLACPMPYVLYLSMALSSSVYVLHYPPPCFDLDTCLHLLLPSRWAVQYLRVHPPGDSYPQVLVQCHRHWFGHGLVTSHHHCYHNSIVSALLTLQTTCYVCVCLTSPSKCLTLPVIKTFYYATAMGIISKGPQIILINDTL